MTTIFLTSNLAVSLAPIEIFSIVGRQLLSAARSYSEEQDREYAEIQCSSRAR